MDKYARIQAKKADLLVKIDQQRQEIKQTLLDIRSELEPLNLLKNAVSSAFSAPTDSGKSSAAGALRKGIPFVLGLLIRDPRLSIIAKSLAPVALRYWSERKVKAAEKDADTAPAALSGEEAMKEPPNKIIGRLRTGVSSLRKKIKKPKNESEKIQLTEHK